MASNFSPDLVRDVAKRRTFAIISHPDAGKTTLTEKLLLFAGAIQIEVHGYLVYMRSFLATNLAESFPIMAVAYDEETIGIYTTVAGFAVSIFTLLFVARVFQTSYLIWPLTGIAVAALLASRRPAKAV